MQVLLKLLLCKDLIQVKLLEDGPISDRNSENMRYLMIHITRLKYEDQLPEHVQGGLHNTLIRSYQGWKGTSYVPQKTDELLRWSSNDPMEMSQVITDSPWPILDKYKKTKTTTKSVTHCQDRKDDQTGD